VWCARRDSNPRPSDSKFGCTAPTLSHHLPTAPMALEPSGVTLPPRPTESHPLPGPLATTPTRTRGQWPEVEIVWLHAPNGRDRAMRGMGVGAARPLLNPMGPVSHELVMAKPRSAFSDDVGLGVGLAASLKPRRAGKVAEFDCGYPPAPPRMRPFASIGGKGVRLTAGWTAGSPDHTVSSHSQSRRHLHHTDHMEALGGFL